MNTIERMELRRVLRRAFREDWGHGDVTSELTVPAERHARAFVRAKADGVVAGIEAVAVGGALVGGVHVQLLARDGQVVKPGTVLAELAGPARTLLAIERVVLNVIQHLSGVATLTRRYVDAVAGTNARIVDTRKTLPGLRWLQKYAVRVGGGGNHRFGLSDGILIKNNHIAVAGGITNAVQAARRHGPHHLRVQVECASLEEVEEALAAGAEALLLDNMDVPLLRTAVRTVGRRAITEASGGVCLDNVRAIAETGVDLISVGALTHSAAALDVHMRLEL